MKNIVFFLEEPSAKAMIQTIIPRIDTEKICRCNFIVFQGKSDFDKNIEQKLKYYLTPDTQFILIRDKDSDDCLNVKKALLQKCINAGKSEFCSIRIPCHELETFYLGDIGAVEKAFSIDLLKVKDKAKFRNPDNLANPKQELKKITNNRYEQIAGSRKIGLYLKLDGSNKSKSFNVLISKLKVIINK